MKRYDVMICARYRVEVEAESLEQAKAAAEEAWLKDDGGLLESWSVGEPRDG